jgi:hypothetical protein
MSDDVARGSSMTGGYSTGSRGRSGWERRGGTCRPVAGPGSPSTPVSAGGLWTARSSGCSPGSMPTPMRHQPHQPRMRRPAGQPPTTRQPRRPTTDVRQAALQAAQRRRTLLQLTQALPQHRHPLRQDRLVVPSHRRADPWLPRLEGMPLRACWAAALSKLVRDTDDLKAIVAGDSGDIAALICCVRDRSLT